MRNFVGSGYFHGTVFPHWLWSLFLVVPVLILVVVVWSLYWKGRALGLSAKKDSLPWFIVLLIVNTVGILEILYIYYFSKRGEGKKEKEAPLENKPEENK